MATAKKPKSNTSNAGIYNSAEPRLFAILVTVILASVAGYIIIKVAKASGYPLPVLNAPKTTQTPSSP